MVSQLQKSKFANEFGALDHNGNGYITADDYEAKAQELANLQGAQPSSPEYRALQERFKKNWNELQKAVDKDNDGRVTLDEYISFAQNAVGEQSFFENYVIATAASMFDLADRDKDGSISLEEYKRCSTSFNVPQGKYEQMFADYDGNGDGRIGKDELLQLVRNYYQS
jgi:Ca2+-binding EF-hand superfamily protein